jgi:hypothetical protein
MRVAAANRLDQASWRQRHGGRYGQVIHARRIVDIGRADSSPKAHRMTLFCHCDRSPTRRTRQRFGNLPYVVEWTIALLHQFRRLRTHFGTRDEIHEAFMSLGCSMICWRRLLGHVASFRNSKLPSPDVSRFGTANLDDSLLPISGFY